MVNKNIQNNFSANDAKGVTGLIVPFLILLVVVFVYKLLDIYAINRVLTNKGYSLVDIEGISQMISLSQIIIVIPVIAMILKGIPLVGRITIGFNKNNICEVREGITHLMKATMFFMLPLSVSYLLLGKLIYGTVYGLKGSMVGGDMLSNYGFTPIMLTSYVFTAVILLGMGKKKWVITSFVIGVSLKILSNQVLVSVFDGSGTSYSTLIGLGITTLIQMKVVQTEGKYNWVENTVHLKGIVVQSITLSLMYFPIGLLSLSYFNNTTNVLILLSLATISAAHYLWRSKMNGTLNEISMKNKKQT